MYIYTHVYVLIHVYICLCMYISLFSRTIKDNLYRRLNSLKRDKSKWIERDSSSCKCAVVGVPSRGVSFSMLGMG